MVNGPTTPAEMEEKGWAFENHEHGYGQPCDHYVSANLTGTGTITITYGSPEHTHGANVYLAHDDHHHNRHHNDDSKDHIAGGHPEKTNTIYFDFAPNDTVMIRGQSGVPLISSVKINCKGTLKFSRFN